MIPIAKIRVSASNEISSVRKGEISCVIGRDVKVDAEMLEDFCFTLLSERAYEIALLAGVIAFTDRRVKRIRSQDWHRQIAIVMPVRSPDAWQESSGVLHEVLQCITGDSWQITFIARRGGWAGTRQDVFPLGRGRFVVVPYSNGLDSFAQSQLLKLESGHLAPIRITAWNRSLAGQRDWMSDSDGTRYRRVSIPITIAKSNHPEPSYRTRSFLFYVFAGIAAHLAQAEFVAIPENGQGSLGPSLVPFGSESPQRGSHPGCTRKIGEFLQLGLGNAIQFEHPQLWRTKGEVLQILKQEKLLGEWTTTTSCPRDRRHVNLNGKSVHCGVCTGCLLRRAAAYVNGLTEPEESYLWPNLGAPTIAGAIHPGSKRKTNANDVDIANHGILAMTELANCIDSSGAEPLLEQCAFEVAGAESLRMTVAKIQRLLQAHKAEWANFRSSFSPESWINSRVALL